MDILLYILYRADRRFAGNGGSAAGGQGPPPGGREFEFDRLAEELHRQQTASRRGN